MYRSDERSAGRNRRRTLLCSTCAVLVFGTCSATAAGALPSGGNFVAGKGTIANSASGTVISQSSMLGIINWNAFSVGAGSSVYFNNGNGATLNRVTGGTGSSINGLLGGSGSVFLINPNGIVIGAGGHVITNGSFIGSTQDLSNSAFLAGGAYNFSGSSNAGVTNEGSITSYDGDVVLVGQSVANSGTISAANGTAGLAAGNNVTLQPVNGDQRISISSGTGSVTNTGAINAAAAELKAADGNVYALAGSNGGIVRATGTQAVAGHIWLTSNGGNVQVTGTLAATNANGSGGAVTVAANNIAMSGQVNVSATSTTGAGGTVSIVANGTDTVSGKILAAGGIKGQGGAIETSGHYLSIDGSTVSAGSGGSWLLDPYDLTVTSSAASSIDSSLGAGTSVTLQTTASGTSGPGTANSSGVGNINIEAPITWSTLATLTLDAYTGINITAPITVSGAGGVVLNTNQGGSEGSLAFGLTSSGFAGNIAFTGTEGAGQSLTINGTAYTLLYSMSEVQNINNSLASLDGNYALANSLNAASTSAWIPIGSNLFVSEGDGYFGKFEGLGNTISNLTINGTNSNVGLFAVSSGTISDIGVVGGSVTSSGTNVNYVGGLVGFLYGTINNSFATDSVSAVNSTGNSGSGYVGGLVGESYVGTINNSYATGAVSTNNGEYAGGLDGIAFEGAINESFATGAVSGGANTEYLGGLVGGNYATIANSFATGAVSGGTNARYVGGLVGINSGAAISNSFTTGAVSVSGGSDSSGLGGLAGLNTGGADPGTIVDSYATGAVTFQGQSAANGGLVGINAGTTTSSYWDTTTSGNPTSGGGTGLTTAQLEAALPSGFSNTVWGTGTGLFPYFLWQFPTTPEVISGYADGSNGSAVANAMVDVYAGGNQLAGAPQTSGANGYFYALAPAGSVTSATKLGETITLSGAAGVSGLTYTDQPTITSGNVANFNVTSGAVAETTADAALSALNADLAATFGSATYTAIAAQISDPIQSIQATNANGFTVDESLALSGLTLNATQDIAFDAPVTISGAGAVVLTTTAGGTAGNLSFDLGASGFAGSLSFTGGSSSGASLTINGIAYTLIYSMSGMSNIDNNLGSGFALADSFASTGTTWIPIGINSSGDILNVGYGFGGLINGLGNTISGFTISASNLPYVGLFGYSSGYIRNLGLAGGSVVGVSNTGADVGDLVGYNAGSITNVFATGNVSATNSFNVGGLVGWNASAGAIANVYATGSVRGNEGAGGLAGENDGSITNAMAAGNVSGPDYDGGLVGYNIGSISQSYATGSVAGTQYIGGLVGENDGPISNDYATGAISGSSDIGGLVGYNNSGTITNAYASGTVTGSSNSVGGLAGGNAGAIADSDATGTVTGGSSAYGIGGLVGENSGGITNAYAMGAVRGGVSSVGGLVGDNGGTISDAYATGEVSSTAAVGGLVGTDSGSNDITSSYWDTGTTGVGTSAGVGNIANDNGATGLTTAQLQGALPAGFTNASWNTASGLFPYLLWQYPVAGGTPQEISGFAYTNTQATPLSSASAGVAIVSALVNGTSEGSVATGADGSYYFLLVPNTISSGGSAVLAYTTLNATTGATNAATLENATGSLGNYNIWGNTLIAPTSATTYSAASATSLQTQDAALIAQATGSNSAAQAVVASPTNFGYIATGTSFTIDQPLTLTDGLTVQTTASNANIIVGDALTLPGSELLTLAASGNVLFDANVTVTGGGALSLAYGSLDSYSIATGDNISFTGGSASHASLSIEGSPYMLLYNMSGVQAINASSATLSSDYALATSLNASGISNWIPIGTNGAGTVVNGFSGVFAGLGNTISNLTINLPNTNFVGLFGYSSGTIRDIGLIGGSVSGGNNVGALAGVGGTISNAYAKGAVSGISDVGGLAGNATGPISDSYASGAVSGAGQSVGGLAGAAVSINNSYASGSVTGTGNFVGGLVGSESGTIVNSYATGAVDGSSDVGGLVGQNDGSVVDSYATGAVSGSGAAGGLVGLNEFGGTIASGYWNTQTSGQNNGIGSDDNSQSGNVAGMTTTQLQGLLPSGFSGTVWGTGTGLFPYLLWQFANTPEAISGYAYSSNGIAVSGAAVDIYAGGTQLAGAPQTSGANGYFYVLAPGGAVTSNTRLGETITLNGAAQVSGLSYTDQPTLASGNVSNFNVASGAVSETTAESNLSALNADLSATFGSGAYASISSQISSPSLSIAATNAAGFTINAPLSGASVALASLGTLGESGSGTITAGTLTGSSSGTTSLPGNNAIAALGAFSTNNNSFVLNDTAALTVSGALNVGSSYAELFVAGTLGESGSVTAAAFAGSSEGNATLGATGNAITYLGGFTTGNGALVLNDSPGLQVTGAINAGSGNITLSTGAGNGLGLYAPVTGGTVTLSSGGAISATSAGAITAATLTGSSGGLVLLPAANSIAALGAFTTNNGSFILNDTGNLSLSGALNTGSATANLVVGGTIGQTSAGAITAGGLTGSSVGSTTLNADNAIAYLGTFTTSNGAFALNNGVALQVTGALNAGSGAIALTTTAGDLGIYAPVTGGAVTLTSGGAIDNSSSGVITANTLSGSSVGATTLVAANVVGTFGAFTTNNAYLALDDTQNMVLSGALHAGSATLNLVSGGTISQSAPITAGGLTGSSVGNATLNANNTITYLGSFTTSNGAFALNDSTALQVTGALNAGTGNLALTTAAGSDLGLYAPVTGGAVTLTSGGAINNTSAGVITAATLSGSSVGNTTLLAANAIATFGAFTTQNAYLALDDTQNMVLSGVLNVGSATLNLVSSGSISQSAAITAGGLTGSSVGNATLNANNAITYLGPFTTSNGAFALTDSESLQVTSALNAGTGNVSLTTATGGDLGIYAPVTGAAVTFTSGGAIDNSSSGVITATTLSGSSVGATTLIAANVVGTFGAFTTQNAYLALNDTQNVVLSGALNAGNATVSLVSGGTISQSAAITAGGLTGSSVGNTTLNGNNAITYLGPFTTSNGALALNDGVTLQVTGALNAGSGNLALTTAAGSDLDIYAPVTGGAVSLASGGAINNASAGVITAATLSGSSQGGVFLEAANTIADLGAFTTGNNAFELNDTIALTLNGALNAGTSFAELTVGGTLSESGAGAITAQAFAGSSTGNASLTGNNAITYLGGFATGNGVFALTDIRGLQVTGAVNSGTGNLTLTTTAGSDIDIYSPLTGAIVDLVSGGAASESSSGAIIANLLDVTAETGIDLNSPLNQIGQVGTDTTASGPNSITL